MGEEIKQPTPAFSDLPSGMSNGKGPMTSARRRRHGRMEGSVSPNDADNEGADGSGLQPPARWAQTSFRIGLIKPASIPPASLGALALLSTPAD